MILSGEGGCEPVDVAPAWLPVMDLHIQCPPLAETSPAKQAKTDLDSYCFARRGLFFARYGLSVSLSAATVSTGKGESGGEPVGRCSDGPTASKRLAVMAAMKSERLDVTEAMLSKCIGCEAAMFAASSSDVSLFFSLIATCTASLCRE